MTEIRVDPRDLDFRFIRYGRLCDKYVTTDLENPGGNVVGLFMSDARYLDSYYYGCDQIKVYDFENDVWYSNSNSLSSCECIPNSTKLVPPHSFRIAKCALDFPVTQMNFSPRVNFCKDIRMNKKLVDLLIKSQLRDENAGN